MWVRAGAWCMRYLTDGFVPDWWVRQQVKGVAKAKRLVDAGLWTANATREGEKGWQFHEFTAQGRQDSRAQIEAEREKWRKKKAGQRAMSPGDTTGGDADFCEKTPQKLQYNAQYNGQKRVSYSPVTTTNAGEKTSQKKDTENAATSDYGSMSPGDTPGESPGESPYARVTPARTNPTHKKELLTHLESATHDSNARKPRSAPVDPDAWTLVRETIPAEHPQPVRTELALQASTLIKTGSAADDVAAALRLWLTKSLGPKTLPSLVSEVINTRNRPTAGPGAPRQPPAKRKVSTAIELAAKFAQTATDTPALEPR